MKNLFYSLFFILSCNVYSQFNIDDFFTFVDIPDANFKNALLNHTSPVIDSNGDGQISIYEAKQVTKILAGAKNISSIQGIASFENIEQLSISVNNIQNIDLSNNTKLKKLYCSQNNLQSLDLSQNTSLELLRALDNDLVSLKVDSDFLTMINITRNNLTSVNLSNCPNLTYFEAQANQLTSLDVSRNTNLEYLYLPANNLSGTLDVSFCKLKELNVGTNTQLKSIKMINQPLTRFTASNNLSSLESICVDTSLIPLVNAELNRVGLTNVTVTDSCDVPAQSNGFSDYFNLSPNPAYGKMILTRVDNPNPIKMSLTADILNMSGVVVKTVPLLFGGVINPNFSQRTIRQTIDNGAVIFVEDLPQGNYIFSIRTSKGYMTAQFRRIYSR